MIELTRGAVETIMTGGEVIGPVLQILGSKEISGQGPNVRYRILISDGVYFNSYAMLASNLTPMLKNGELVENTVVKVTNHVASIVKNPERGDRRIMVILALEVIMHGSEVGMKIGNPIAFDANTQAQAPTNNTSGMNSVSGKQLPPPARQIFPAETSYRRPSGNLCESTIFNSSKTVKTHPIASISPYQNNWTIKVRVTSKSPIRTWSNPRTGEGKLFSVDLVDESGEIRATAFKDQVDKFYDMIQENKLYYISKCSVKMANKKFSSLKNDYEMSFTHDTSVVPCEEEDSTIPSLQFNFSHLTSIQDAEPGTLLDFIGVCKQAGDVVTLTARTTNRELKKRDITLVDRSLAAYVCRFPLKPCSRQVLANKISYDWRLDLYLSEGLISKVTLTLWGSQAEDFKGEDQPVVAVKGGKVSEFGGGKTVSLIGSSVFQINPDIPEAHRLKGWFDGLTDDAKFNSLSTRMDTGAGSKFYLIGEAIAAKLGCGDKAEYFNTYATIMHIRTERCVYKACPTPDCQKKVIDQNNGQYRCEKCNREFDSFKYRLMLSVNIGDFSGHQWITMFQDSAEALLETTAEEIGRWQEEDNEKFSALFQKVTLQPYNFRLRAKMETFNDESRLKLSAFSVKKPDYQERCRKLISEIKELSGIGKSY